MTSETKLSKLANPPEFDRLLSAVDGGGESASIDPTGGKFGGGLIRGVSITSPGEALGHGLWLDSEFVQSIVDATNQSDGIKSRFTHPGLCSDGMGKAVGLAQDATLRNGKAVGDLHLFESAHKAPDGDLAGYVLSLAKESPGSFGLSIVFKHDFEAEVQFALDHGAEWAVDDDGFKYVDMSSFKSPDPLNVANFPHARLLWLLACDVVDSPAANPDGLFHRGNELLEQASGLMDFVLGRSQQTPRLSAFGVEVAPERVKTFVQGYLASAGLTVQTTKQEANMADSKEKPVDLAAKDDEKKPVDAESTKDKKGDPAPSDPAKETDDDSADDEPEEEGKKKSSKCSTPAEKSDLAKFCEVFGHESGAKYFLEGVSFEAAQSKHIVELKAQLAERDKKLEAFAKSGVSPVAASFAQDKKRGETNHQSGSDAERTAEQKDNRSRFAEANKTTEEVK